VTPLVVRRRMHISIPIPSIAIVYIYGDPRVWGYALRISPRKVRCTSTSTGTRPSQFLDAVESSQCLHPKLRAFIYKPWSTMPVVYLALPLLLPSPYLPIISSTWVQASWVRVANLNACLTPFPVAVPEAQAPPPISHSQ
jgi:hypothetical protein